MNSLNQTVSAIAIRNDTIIGVGKLMDFIEIIRRSTRLVNLKRETVVPGFYDGHSHYSLSAILATQGFDLFSAPFGNVTSIADIIANVKKYIADNNIPPGSNVYGSGYD
jgi:predicted amidohydrolase YtcJ